jgi:uncharacterized protein
MTFRLLPRDPKFFELFIADGDNLEAAARALNEMVEQYDRLDERVAAIQALEKRGDEIDREVTRKLEDAFVTPFDREDIHQLASGLDDILDGVEAVADMFVLHHIKEPLPEMRQQADVLASAAEELHQAMGHLRSLRGLEPHWVEINRLENEGDRVYRKTVAALFSGDYKAMDVLKWKDIVDQLEGAIDGCEDVANTLESIVLKHA